MKKYTFIFAGVALMLIGIAILVTHTGIKEPFKPTETYSIAYTCPAPFMRQSRGEAVMKRDSDGVLFFRNGAGKIEAVDQSAKFKDLCP